MPQPQNEDSCVHDFVSQLVLTNDDPANLARRICVQFLANARIIEQPIRRMCELLDDTGRWLGRDRLQMLIEPNKEELRN